MTLPLTIFGGYLGAGKTTLINGLLRHANGQRLAVLVNEFGTLPIDADLIEAQEGNMISLAGGCICCAFGDNLAGALADLAGLDLPPDHLLVEASGVALPGALAANIDLLSFVTLMGVVVLADAETIRKQAQNRYIGDTILRQLQGSDLVVLTKTDLVEDETAVATRAWLAERAGHDRVLDAPVPEAAAALLLGNFNPHVSGAASAPHGPGYATFILRPDSGQDPALLAARLADSAFGLVRAKGFVLDTNGQATLIQVVGRRWSVAPWGQDITPGIVCIGLPGFEAAQATLQADFAASDTNRPVEETAIPHRHDAH